MQRDHEARLVNFRQLLAHDLLVAEVLEPGTAIFLIRPGQQKPHLAGLLPHAAVDHAGLFPRVLMRQHLLVEKGTEGVAEHVVFGVEDIALHAGLLPGLKSSSRVGAAALPPQ
ncbi:hypothetical protein FQZ97_1042490 [compost metagenome]